MDHSTSEAAVHDPADGSHVEDGVVEHPTAEDFGHARTLPEDRTWFKRAVFYEVLVRAFYDSNSDGCGDLRGLTEQLDYLKWLGVDCLWLPPFYASPLRDGGYDIRDFYKVLPEFGTVDDFVELLDAAHRHGIRVITGALGARPHPRRCSSYGPAAAISATHRTPVAPGSTGRRSGIEGPGPEPGS